MGRLAVDMLDASAITTGGLVYMLFHWAEVSRSDARAEFCHTYLKKIAVNSLSVLSQGGGHCYLQNGDRLTFDAAGVCNVYECLHCHKAIKDSLCGSWNEMKEDAKVATNFSEASIIDLVYFLASVRRHRRKLKKRCWSANTTDMWCLCLWSVVKFLAASINHQCRNLQRRVEGIADRIIPSRKKAQSNSGGNNADDPETHSKDSTCCLIVKAAM
jgi:hypothetical protein